MKTNVFEAYTFQHVLKKKKRDNWNSVFHRNDAIMRIIVSFLTKNELNQCKTITKRWYQIVKQCLNTLKANQLLQKIRPSQLQYKLYHNITSIQLSNDMVDIEKDHKEAEYEEEEEEEVKEIDMGPGSEQIPINIDGEDDHVMITGDQPQYSNHLLEHETEEEEEEEEELIVDEKTYQFFPETNLLKGVEVDQVHLIYPTNQVCQFRKAEQIIELTTFTMHLEQVNEGYLSIHMKDIDQFFASPKLLMTMEKPDIQEDMMCWMHHEPLFSLTTFIQLINYFKDHFPIKIVKEMVNVLQPSISISFVSQDEVDFLVDYLREFDITLPTFVDSQTASKGMVEKMAFLVQSLYEKKLAIGYHQYMGEVSHHLPDGYGELRKPSTMKTSFAIQNQERYYQGHFKDGMIHGHGTYQGDTFMYRGLFHHGEYDEFGFLTVFSMKDVETGHADLKSLYEGQFRCGQRHGHGRMMNMVDLPSTKAIERYGSRLLKDTNQSFYLDYYIGEWKYDQFYGRGQYRNAFVWKKGAFRANKLYEGIGLERLGDVLNDDAHWHVCKYAHYARITSRDVVPTSYEQLWKRQLAALTPRKHLVAQRVLYRGYCYRSRLECRWARFFEVLGIDYVYEPETFLLVPPSLSSPRGIRYTPDFYLPLLGFFLEIKPCAPTEDERFRAQLLRDQVNERVFILYGSLTQPFLSKNLTGAMGVELRPAPSKPLLDCCWTQCPTCHAYDIGFRGQPTCHPLPSDMLSSHHLSSNHLDSVNSSLYDSIHSTPREDFLYTGSVSLDIAYDAVKKFDIDAYISLKEGLSTNTHSPYFPPSSS